MSKTKIISGTFVSLKDGQLILSHVGESAPNSKTDIRGVPVFINGKASAMSDLKERDLITLQKKPDQPVTRVDATRG